MISNVQFSTMLPESIYSCIAAHNPTFVLCVGSMPDDATWDTVTNAMITTSGSFVYNATTLTLAPTGASYALKDTSSYPPLWYMASVPTISSGLAARAGTIGWAVVYFPNQYILAVDVSLPNQGGVLQVDKTSVAVGDTINLMGFSFSAGR